MGSLLLSRREAVLTIRPGPGNVVSPAFWYEPSKGGLYQDSAGTTTAATADTDPIGYLPDLSGNGFHATQSTSGARPILKTTAFNGLACARLDGTDDAFSLGNPSGLATASNGSFTLTYCIKLASFPLVATILARGNVQAALNHWIGSFNSSIGIAADYRASGTPSPVLSTSNRYVITERTTFDGVGMLHEIYVNGVILGRYGGPAIADTGNWMIGCRQDGLLLLPGDLGALVFYRRAVSDIEANALEAYFGATYGVTVTARSAAPATPLNIVIDGDSIPGGYNSFGSYSGRARGLITTEHTLHCAAVDGATTASRTATVATRVAPLLDPARFNIVVMQEITNEFAFGTDAATCYANVLAYCAAIRGLSTSVKLVIVTPLSRNMAPNQAAYEAVRQSVMSSMRANGSPPWDYLLDFGNSGTITVFGQSFDVSALGAPAAYASGTYFNDGVHPSPAGHTLLSAPFAAAINGIVALG